jgi:hypothetical protein
MFVFMVRVLGLVLVITPVVWPVLITWKTLAFPPQAILEYVEEWGGFPYPYWGMRYLLARYLLTRYFAFPGIGFPALVAFTSGLWLFFGRLSWKNIFTALLVAGPWFLLLCINWSYGMYGS